MKKKFAAIFCALMLLLNIQPVLAAGSNTISVQAGEVIKGESSWVVSVNIDGDQPYSNGKLRIAYDADKLTLKDDRVGGLLTNASTQINDVLHGNKQEGEVVFVFASANTLKTGGTLLNLTFGLKDSVKAGDELAVNVSAEEFKNGDSDCAVTVSQLKTTVKDPYVETKTVYRAYNPNDGDHLFTTSKHEWEVTIAAGWNNEGTAWICPGASSIPVYRVYDKNSGEHHYSSDEHEISVLVKEHGWSYEGVAWYSDENEQASVYRLYNPNATGAGRHHYTLDSYERSVLIKEGWSDEGVGFHAIGK